MLQEEGRSSAKTLRLELGAWGTGGASLVGVFEGRKF